MIESPWPYIAGCSSQYLWTCDHCHVKSLSNRSLGAG